jgi:hypothetical protein
MSPESTTPPAVPGPAGAGPGALRRALTDPTGFATVVELVPWAGALQDPKGVKPMKMAADLVGNPRITSISVTDNAGGFAKLAP